MDAEQLVRDVQQGFQYATARDNWTTPLRDVLEGVSAADAAWKPAEDEPSIWAIVNHMRAWTEYMANYVESMSAEWPDDSWPKVEGLDDATWDETVKGLFAALDRFEAQLQRFRAEELLSPHNGQQGSRLGASIKLFVHTSYHTGQITKLRERLEAEADV